MQRTNIYLEERQTAALDELARSEGLTRAEVIRRLVDAGLARRTAQLQDDVDAIERSFAALMDVEVGAPERHPTAREKHLDALWHR